MATPTQIQWLLRLPSALRCRLISPLEKDLLHGSTLQRPFTTTSSIYAKGAAKPPKPSLAKPKPSPSQPQPKPFKSNRTPPRPSSNTSDLAIDTSIRKLLAKTGQVLLYYSPNHNSFFLSSYIFGSLFLLSSVVQASMTRAEREKIPWYTRAMTASVAIFTAALGTALILAPSKLIRSVSLIRSVANSAGREDHTLPFLRFEIKSSVPFSSKSRVLDAPMSHVRIDRTVATTEPPLFYNVPLHKAKAFTDYHGDSTTQTAESEGQESAEQKTSQFNRPGLRLWASWKQNTRRMLLRDGMAYVKIADYPGYWKLDLNNAELLDKGQAITGVMKSSSFDRSFITWVRNVMKF